MPNGCDRIDIAGALKFRLHGVPQTSGNHAQLRPSVGIAAYSEIRATAQVCDFRGKAPQFGNNIAPTK